MKSLFAVGLMIAAIPALAVAQNPFAGANVGDWAEYKLVTTAQGVNYEAKLKMAVTGKEGQEVKIRSTITEEFAGKIKTINPVKKEITYTYLEGKTPKERTIQIGPGSKMWVGNAEAKFEELKLENDIKVVNEINSPETKIDLTKPYDSFSASGLPGTFAAVVEKDGNGKENILPGRKGKDDKGYDCTWDQVKMKGMVGGMEVESVIKVWTAKEVPLSGMVKFEMKSKFIDTSMELIGSGKK